MSNEIYGGQCVPLAEQHYNKSEMQKIDNKEDIAVAEDGYSIESKFNKLELSEDKIFKEDYSIGLNESEIEMNITEDIPIAEQTTEIINTETNKDKFFVPDQNMENDNINSTEDVPIAEGSLEIINMKANKDKIFVPEPNMTEFVSRCNSKALDPENLYRRHSSMVENLQQETQIQQDLDNSDENCVKPLPQYSNNSDQRHQLVNSQSSCTIYILNNYGPVGGDSKILKKDVSNPNHWAYNKTKGGENLIHKIALDKDVIKNKANIADKFNFKTNPEDYTDPYDYIYSNLTSFCTENKTTRHQLLVKLNSVVDVSHLCHFYN